MVSVGSCHHKSLLGRLIFPDHPQGRPYPRISQPADLVTLSIGPKNLWVEEHIYAKVRALQRGARVHTNDHWPHLVNKSGKRQTVDDKPPLRNARAMLNFCPLGARTRFRPLQLLQLKPTNANASG